MDVQKQSLAMRIMQLTQGTLVANNHFLAGSIGLLQLEVCEQAQSFSTNGSTLFVDANHLISTYLDEQQPPVHDYVHILAHCLFLHPFVGTHVHSAAWSLACDIIAEMIVADIVGLRAGERGNKIEAILESLYDDFAGKLTAERLYHSFSTGGYANMLPIWQPLFFVDDHALWFASKPQTTPQQPGGASKSEGASGSEGLGKAEGASTAEGANGAQEAYDKQDAAAHGASQSDSDGTVPQDQMPEQAESPSSEFGSQPQPSSHADAKEANISLAPEQMKRAQEHWSQAARSMRVDLETLSRERGSKLRGLMHQLMVSQHEEVDYREFLRQFATYQEDMRLSDDEFDYIFYTYGLSLYEDMPLIEPLEYSNKNRIRDFVIVIDTSSSVTGKIVQQFIDTTYDVLCSTESFFEKINVHIIQCDLQVRSDTKITSVGEMNQWRQKIELRGLSGTDFRPAFRYIQELRQKGEFDDLAGVIYFTDGWGIYPEAMPPFKTAFVFYDEDHRPDLVPAWAIQLTINAGQFESLSVY
ncbi:MAG: VWA-like domain-containing protein [Atopobium sp.]|uniref:vWA domain-containing protein n=1 Tax=Atopobium sp. TaxID=1872650 RepID=UPI002A758C83|nr:VWA-like domain-containing protein [Atopobium sp.]MDY2788875.1 VWA-like domain-containing protein [Atopobium sp.]